MDYHKDLSIKLETQSILKSQIFKKSSLKELKEFEALLSTKINPKPEYRNSNEFNYLKPYRHTKKLSLNKTLRKKNKLKPLNTIKQITERNLETDNNLENDNVILHIMIG